MGLNLQGATCKKNKLQLSTTISTKLPVTLLRWISVYTRTDADKVVAGKVTLPVYLNATRSHLLFMLDFDTEGEGSGKDHSFYERGVAIISYDLG
eukprot:XP_011456687.1 PREDICTED: cytoplasmic dynein 1 heavy chain 1 [Crassostrea gigas]